MDKPHLFVDCEKNAEPMWSDNIKTSTKNIRDVTKRLKQGINEEDIDYIQISIACTTSIKYKNIIYNARLKDTNK